MNGNQKMSDIDILIRMFDRNNIEYYPEGTKEDGTSALSIHAGHIGFHSVFTFDKDGNLKSVEAYE